MSYQYMTDCLVEVIQELRDYLGLGVFGLFDENVVHRVMCQALDYQRQLSELKPKETLRQKPSHRYGQL